MRFLKVIVEPKRIKELQTQCSYELHTNCP